MCRVTALLCSLLLVAVLFGLAHSEGSSQGVHADVRSAAALVQEALCGEGEGLGACQPVIQDQIPAPDPGAVTALPRFAFAPDAAPSRTPSPRKPPPRQAA